MSSPLIDVEKQIIYLVKVNKKPLTRKWKARMPKGTK